MRKSLTPLALLCCAALAGCGGPEAAKPTPTAEPASSSSAITTLATPTPSTTSADVNVLSGTVRVIDAKTAAEPRQIPQGVDPNSTYVVLELDSPTAVVGVVAGDPNHAQTVTRVGFIDEGPWRARAGQRVTISVPRDSVHYPSGAELPADTPRLGDRVEILG